MIGLIAGLAVIAVAITITYKAMMEAAKPPWWEVEGHQHRWGTGPTRTVWEPSILSGVPVPMATIQTCRCGKERGYRIPSNTDAYWQQVAARADAARLGFGGPCRRCGGTIYAMDAAPGGLHATCAEEMTWQDMASLAEEDAR